MTDPQQPAAPPAAPPSAPPAGGFWDGAAPPVGAHVPPAAWQPGGAQVPPGQPYVQQPPAPQPPPGFYWQPTSLTEPSAPVLRPRPPLEQPPLPIQGLVVTTIGLVMLVLSTTALTWFSSGFFATDFGSLHRASDAFDGPWFFTAYFSWLAITLLILSAITSYATKVFRPTAAALTLSALLLSLGGAVATFCAPLNGNSFHEVMKASDAGYWCMIFGFVLVGLGALVRA